MDITYTVDYFGLIGFLILCVFLALSVFAYLLLKGFEKVKSWFKRS